jgi:hypothetical protein
MKLRILGDSLRLRLSRSEVERMGSEGRVEDAIRFGPAVRLGYVLVVDASIDAPQASFADGQITVRVPVATARVWVDTDQVGFSAKQGELAILVEKDFKCAVPRPGEEDYDGFDPPGPEGREDNPDVSC